jgi:acetate---CoA ligase (ADP-forming)
MTSDTCTQLSQIFSAESVALVGASDKEGSFGRLFLEGLVEMGCRRIYPVNPRRDEMLGVKAFPSITAVPDTIDVAILLTPPEAVPGLVKECVVKRLKGVVVFAAGFGELGAEGRNTQLEIARVAREGGVRIIGPNCLGFFNPAAGILTFPQALIEGIPKQSGTVGGFSQSGSFVDLLVWFLARKGVRFSTIVSCGNECDLAGEDYLEYLGKDENTETIVAYVEGVKDGRRFFEIAREVAAKKPIILWKGGLSEEGARAAASHTGALAGSVSIWNALFRQTGMVNVTCMQEVVDCTLAFHYLPLPAGRRTAVITAHGGTGVGTADNCLSLGLELPRFSEETASRLRGILPKVGTSIGNPADIGVASVLDPGLYGEAVRTIAEDPNVDMILVNTSPIRACEESIIQAAKTIRKPLAISIFALPELVPEEYQLFAENGIPAYPDPKRAAYALSRLAEYARSRGDGPGKEKGDMRG